MDARKKKPTRIKKTRSSRLQSLYVLTPLGILAGIAMPITTIAQSPSAPSKQSGSVLADRISNALKTSFGPTFDFGDQVTPYKDFPFPDVPRGQMWQPNLAKIASTTFVPTGDDALFTSAQKDILARGKALVDAGNGQGAIDLYEQNLDFLPDGEAMRKIGDIYLAGTGGVAKNTPLGRQWVERAAEHNPHLYNWLGRTLGESEDDTVLKLHFWSKGLSRGCTGCFGLLFTLTRSSEVQGVFDVNRLLVKGTGRETKTVKTKIVPDELLLQYAAYGAEMGDDVALNVLKDLVLKFSVSPKSTKAKVPGIGQALFDAALARLGNDTSAYMEVIWGGAVTDTIRTGLVPANFLLAQQRSAAGNHVGAMNALAMYSSGGRYYPDIANAVMKKVPRGVGTTATVNTIAVRAANAGDASHAPAAALILKEGYARIRLANNGWESYRPASVPERTWRAYLRFASQSGQLRPEVNQFINAGASQIAATKANADARACLNRVNTSREKSLQMWLNCRSDTYRAWSLTDEVDFGVLDDLGFDNLSAAATAEHEAEYKRRLDGASARMARNLAERSAPRTDFSGGVVAAGQLKDHLDQFARLNSQNFENMPRYYDQVQEWKRAYQTQRNKVASGRARDAREGALVRGSATTCAIWSLKVMPFCSEESMSLPISSGAATTSLPPATTAVACKARYKQISGRINNTAPGVIRVTAEEIGWAFDYEKAVRAGKGCP